MSDRNGYGAVGIALTPDALPAITREQACRIRDKIVRHFNHECNGRWRMWVMEPKGRRVWISTRPTHRHNGSKGLGRLVHDMSHALFEAVYGDRRRQHDPLHLGYEKRIAEYVGENIPKWFKTKTAPTPKPEPTKADKRAAKLAKTQAAITRWTVKHKRAVNKLRKLRARERGLMRAIARGIGWEP